MLQQQGRVTHLTWGNESDEYVDEKREEGEKIMENIEKMAAQPMKLFQQELIQISTLSLVVTMLLLLPSTPTWCVSLSLSSPFGTYTIS
jgi:hypothetical protein